jgi:hypothetical protein
VRIKKPVNLANISSDLGSPGAAIDWDLVDNNPSALSFDADGQTGILNIVTTNEAEGVEINGFLSLVDDLKIGSNALLSGGGADGKLILSNLAGSQGVLFDTTTDGQLTLTDESGGALNLRIDGRIFDGAGPLNLGKSAATSHSLTNEDTLIGGKLEVDGTVYFDGGAYINGTFSVGNNQSVMFGDPYANRFIADTSQGQFLFATSSYTGNHMVVIPIGFSVYDYYHAEQTHPTMYIHSNVVPTTDRYQFSSIAWNKFGFADHCGLGAVTKSFAYDDMTDGGGVVGTIDFDEQIPDGAVVVACILHTLTGFTGGANSTATIQVGDGTVVDRYNTGTPDVYTSNASGVDMGAISGTAWHDAAKTVTVTITVDSDWSTVSAGECTVGILYWSP